MNNIILISLFSTVIFGMIDAFFFLFFEETLQKNIKKLLRVNMDLAEILTGAISASVAVFAMSTVKISLKEEKEIINNPLLDVFGIIIGTMIVVISYLGYYKFLRCVFFPLICKKD